MINNKLQRGNKSPNKLHPLEKSSESGNQNVSFPGMDRVVEKGRCGEKT